MAVKELITTFLCIFFIEDRLILTGSRSRIVWDKAHLVYLENVYKKEVQHPNIEQCQLYAEELCQIPLTGKKVD